MMNLLDREKVDLECLGNLMCKFFLLCVIWFYNINLNIVNSLTPQWPYHFKRAGSGSVLSIFHKKPYI